MTGLRIDRCICRDLKFSELQRIAKQFDVQDLRSLQKYARFGDNCELCHPYVREMLVSGTVVFRELLEGPELPDDGA